MYRNILLPVDLGDEHSWRKALPTALALCKTFGAALHVVTVVPDFGLPLVAQYFPPDYEARMHQQVADRLKEFVAAQVPGEPVQSIVAAGNVYHEILTAAERVGADLIVMGSHRPELSDYLLGPNAARVVRHADCSVMVVRG